MKKTINDIEINSKEKEAVKEIKHLLFENFPVRKIIIFGSKAKGNAVKDSDIDLLVVTEKLMSHKQRGEMSALAFEVDIKYQTCISLVIVDEQSWNGPSSFTQLYKEIEEDGVLII